MTYQTELSELIHGFVQRQLRWPNEAERQQLCAAAADATGEPIPGWPKPQRKQDVCKNCGLPIRQHERGMWYHSTLEKEVNIEGADVMTIVTDCPNDLGEAEPQES